MQPALRRLAARLPELLFPASPEVESLLDGAQGNSAAERLWHAARAEHGVCLPLLSNASSRCPPPRLPAGGLPACWPHPCTDYPDLLPLPTNPLPAGARLLGALLSIMAQEAELPLLLRDLGRMGLAPLDLATDTSGSIADPGQPPERSPLQRKAAEVVQRLARTYRRLSRHAISVLKASDRATATARAAGLPDEHASLRVSYFGGWAGGSGQSCLRMIATRGGSRLRACPLVPTLPAPCHFADFCKAELRVLWKASVVIGLESCVRDEEMEVMQVENGCPQRLSRMGEMRRIMQELMATKVRAAAGLHCLHPSGSTSYLPHKELPAPCCRRSQAEAAAYKQRNSELEALLAASEQRYTALWASGGRPE